MSNMKLSCEVRKNINKDSSYYSTKRGVQPSWSCRDSPGICLEIPSPDQHTIGIIKITILTSVLIFSKTSTRCILRASKRSASPCSPWSRYDFESRERPGRVGDRSCCLHHNLYKKRLLHSVPRAVRTRPNENNWRESQRYFTTKANIFVTFKIHTPFFRVSQMVLLRIILITSGEYRDWRIRTRDCSLLLTLYNSLPWFSHIICDTNQKNVFTDTTHYCITIPLNLSLMIQ